MFGAYAAACAAQSAVMFAMEQQLALQAYYVGQYQPPAPCKYCGRTKQNNAHKTCDGCGASKGRVA